VDQEVKKGKKIIKGAWNCLEVESISYNNNNNTKAKILSSSSSFFYLKCSFLPQIHLYFALVLKKVVYFFFSIYLALLISFCPSKIYIFCFNLYNKFFILTNFFEKDIIQVKVNDQCIII